ncbi:tyrosine-type recombinase/integrase [Paenibacillus thailandensis]|uniref:Tyrosine-type recombinase/integrase n=1 Tax=Paenibacillus thailandensis TaxID=393250 RepID=A0ABW5QZS4_9BACL
MTRRKNSIPVNFTLNEGDTPASNIHLAINSFLKTCRAKNLADHTMKYHANASKIIIRMMTYHGLKRTDEITKDHVIDFVNYRQECGIRPASINQNLRSWRVFGTHMVEIGVHETNQFNLEPLKVERLFIKTFSDDQLAVLLDTPRKNEFVGFRDYVLMLLFIETGIRLNEALMIKISDIDWRRGTIKVYGKGRKERAVPFQATLEKHLQNYVRLRGKLDHDFLFVSIDNKPLKARSVQDNLRKYGRLSRIRDVNATPHVFRYTFARLYIQNGGDPFSLKNLLGHTTIAMVNHYVDMWGTDTAEKHAKYSPLEGLKYKGDLR